jgi:peroxin-6
MLKAVTRQASLVDAKIKVINATRAQPITTAYFFDHHATSDDVAVMVTEQDFIDAHRELIPSVSAGELAHYERVRASFEGGRENAKDKTQAPKLGPGAGKRTVSGASRGSGKGKAKVIGKGKGKGVALNSSDEYDEDSPGDEEPVNRYSSRDKGKGVAAPFGKADDDDEGLYD